MKRKLLLSVLLLALVSVFSISAQPFGCRGGGSFGGGRGPGFLSDEAEDISISGTILLEEDKLPLLKVKGVNYAIMVPPFMAREIGLNDGDQVEVEGLAGEGMISGVEFKIVRPRLMTINGETFNLFNQRQGRMSGRGQNSYGGGYYDDCPRNERYEGGRQDKRDRKKSGRNW